MEFALLSCWVSFISCWILITTQPISARTEDKCTMSSKISSVVLEELASAPHTEILVHLKADTAPVLAKVTATEFATRGERATAVSNALKEHAAKEQKELLEYLKSQGLEVQSMWINNQIHVKGASKQIVEWIAARDEVKEIKENAKIVLDDPIESIPQ